MRIPFHWLKEYVDIRLTSEELAKRLTLAGLEVTEIASVGGEPVLVVEVTPNRPDWLSMIGVAREVSVLIGKPLKIPRLKRPLRPRKGVTIRIQDRTSCRRYVGWVLDGVRVGPSLSWMVKRLEAAGIRSINNVVDVTNYVLLEWGQPLHAFDLDKLEGNIVIVRQARQGEELTTIDGEKRTLDHSALVIADAHRPVALAGIMGGKASEVGGSTRRLLLESALFDPITIRRTSRRLGLASESSYRFERSVDSEGVLAASYRAVALLQEHASARVVSGPIDVSVAKPKLTRVSLRLERLHDLLGIVVPPRDVERILPALGFRISQRTRDRLTVEAPSFRRDVAREVDLIEEVGRVYGYDRCPVALPRAAADPRPPRGESALLEEEARATLISLGLDEIITYSLVDPARLAELGLASDDVVALSNPLSREFSALRPGLAPGMLQAIAHNVRRKNTDLAFFELGRSTHRHGGDVRETKRLAVGLSGSRPSDWQRPASPVDFFDLKGIVEAFLSRLSVTGVEVTPGARPAFAEHAVVRRDSRELGFLGKIEPDLAGALDVRQEIFFAELDLDALLPLARRERKFHALPKFPAIVRDVSLLVPRGVASAEITRLIHETAGGCARQVRLFDRYQGDKVPAGTASLAYSIEYRRDDRTLTDDEVNALHQTVVQVLKEKLSVQIR